MSDETASTVSEASSRMSIKDFKTSSREISYMESLRKKLIEKRCVAETTATQTIQALQRLNGGNTFTSMAFLLDIPTVKDFIDKYESDSTRKTYYTRIICAISTTEGTRYKGVLDIYKKLFEGTVDALTKATKERGSALTEKESKSWMSWPDILKHYAAVTEEAHAIIRKKTELTNRDYEKVQDYMLLTLYTQMVPRRNKDYCEMWVTRKAPGDDKSKNYYVINEGKMYFNAYKTAKTHGVQTVDVPKSVQKVLFQYLKLTGCYRRSRGRATLMPLICSYDGAHYTAGGTMTHLLNRAFGKKVSCNIIRHAYISNLYTADVVGMADTAKSMAHGVTTHLSYYRTPVGGAGVTSDSDSDSDEANSSVIEIL
jgi:hypothetical protein